MIGSRITVRDNLGHITARVLEVAAEVVTEGAIVAAAAAQAASSIDLQLEVLPARPVFEGVAAGVESRKRGSASNARLAPFFDGGTLGKRRRKLATGRARRETWNVNRGGSEYVAHRHEITPEMGVAGENFFAKGRRAGRAYQCNGQHAGTQAPPIPMRHARDDEPARGEDRPRQESDRCR